MEKYQQLNVPLYRASTVLFPDTEEFLNRRERLYDGFSYGLYGTPTTRALEKAVAEIEGAARTIALPSGLAALTHPLLALCSAGDHVLIVDCAYGPTRAFAKNVLARLGIAFDFFASDAVSIADRLRPNTRAVVLESPGYYTMEIQDIAAIAAEAHAAGAKVLLDNSWGFGVSSMFAHGVDVCCTALSKYASGSGDLCMGSVSVTDEDLYRRLKRFAAEIGSGVSSDEAYLVMRGLPSMRLRIREQAERALHLCDWLRGHPAVARVINPATPEDPFHQRYRRYFSSGNGLFSVQFKTGELPALRRMIDGLQHFRIGASWGSSHSLVSITNPSASRDVDRWPRESYLVRFHIGLEDIDQLKSDLERAIGLLDTR